MVDICLTKDERLLNIKLENDYTAWHLASEYGSLETVTMLLNKLTIEQLTDLAKAKQKLQN